MLTAPKTGAYLLDLADGILTLTFNRPEVRNAVPTEAIGELETTFKEIAQRQEIRVLFVRARGDSFGGGGDVAGMKRSLEKTPDERHTEYFGRLGRASNMVKAWCALDLPIVAECRGSVAGAAMMYTLGADIVLADDSVYFVCAHQGIGISPDGGISYLLPRAIGEKKAMDMILTARRVDAQEALRIGLVSELVPPAELGAKAEALVRKLSRSPAFVARRAKNLIRQSLATDISAQLDAERNNVAQCASEPDFAEGVTAFLEKRQPDFPSTRS